MDLKHKVTQEVMIDDLPNEVLQNIFSYLNHDDCLKVSLVSRRWNCNAVQIRKVALDITLKKSNLESIVSTLMVSERNYKHFRVSKLGLPVELFGKFSNSLETLEMFWVKEFEFLYELYRLERLERFVVAYTSFPKEFSLLGTPCRSLKALVSDNNEYTSFSNFNAFISVTFPSLTYLKLEDGMFDTLEKFRLSNLPMLEELEIRAGYIINCHLLEDFRSLPNLRSVKLCCQIFREMDRIDPDTRLEHIRSLEVAVRFGDVYLVRLMEIFPALTSFVVKARVEYLVDRVEAKKRIPDCHFEVFELEI